MPDSMEYGIKFAEIHKAPLKVLPLKLIVRMSKFVERGECKNGKGY